MGKLAERLADAQRSGVYRVESTEALEEAAALNGFALERRVPSGDRGKVSPRDGSVLLFSGFEERLRAAPGALAPLLGELEAAASACRQRGERFFAAVLDPAGLLSLPPLYNWKRR